MASLASGERPAHRSSGAGKHCTARYTVFELEREAIIETQYVDCCPTPEGILSRILEGVTPTYDVRHSTPPDERLQRIEGLGTPYVVILDEFDQVTDTADYAPSMKHGLTEPSECFQYRRGRLRRTLYHA